MGRFDDCKETVKLADGDEITTHRNSCVINILLADGGVDKYGLAEDEHDRVGWVSIGRWNDVPVDDPSQRYGLVKLEDPHRFRLIRRRDAAALVEEVFGIKDR